MDQPALVSSTTAAPNYHATIVLTDAVLGFTAFNNVHNVNKVASIDGIVPTRISDRAALRLLPQATALSTTANLL